MVIALLGTVAKLDAKVAAQAEEIARLKDLKGRPKLKASGMEKGTEPGAASGDGDGKPARLRATAMANRRGGGRSGASGTGRPRAPG